MPRYTEDEARAAVAASTTYSDTLRALGLRPAGGNHRVLREWLAVWGISTAHFDAAAGRRVGLRRTRIPLELVMVEGSTYARGALKQRLFDEGLKQRVCELCGQGELWRGRPMSLILDHINGVPDDHRAENLRVVCPNCAATLDTHCGRNTGAVLVRDCARCGKPFRPRTARQRFCGSECGARGGERQAGRPRPATRKTPRPPYDQLLAEIAADGYAAVGRRYGVSDNAVRKWRLAYERAAGGR